jgi:hypothetical protein
MEGYFDIGQKGLTESHAGGYWSVERWSGAKSNPNKLCEMALATTSSCA